MSRRTVLAIVVLTVVACLCLPAFSGEAIYPLAFPMPMFTLSGARSLR